MITLARPMTIVPVPIEMSNISAAVQNTSAQCYQSVGNRKADDFNNAFVHAHRSDDRLIISDCPQQISGFGAHIPVQ